MGILEGVALYYGSSVHAVSLAGSFGYSTVSFALMFLPFFFFYFELNFPAIRVHFKYLC